MWHLKPEELARLVDETPTGAEAEHLAACAACRADLDAMRAEHDALSALPRIVPVPTSWDVMRRRLEREGLLTGGENRFAWMPGVAAALALFLAGGATGVAFANNWSGGREVAVASDPVPSADGSAPVAYTPDTTTEEVPRPIEVETPRTTAAPGSKLAARDDVRSFDEDELPSLRGTPEPSTGTAPNWQVLAARASNARTPDEAARFVRDAEGAYLAAMTRLAELTAVQSTDPAVRLATLDGIVVTTAAALERAPADPVINGYHLAARAQRDALLRTVSTTADQDPWY